MHMPKACSDGFISAVFTHDHVDDDVIERIHRGEVDDWIVDVAASGMFSNAEVCAISQSWRSNPKSLLDALLVNVDEVTAKRCQVTWANLDRIAAPAPNAVSG